MPKRTEISLILLGSMALTPPSSASAKRSGEMRPHRFQVDGWKATCAPGTDGFAAECEAVKKVGAYTLRLSLGDDQFFQFIEHPGCQYESNNVFRDEAPMLSDNEQRRWIVKAFDKMGRNMAKRCPNLPRLNPKAYQHPPALNNAGEGDAG